MLNCDEQGCREQARHYVWGRQWLLSAWCEAHWLRADRVEALAGARALGTIGAAITMALLANVLDGCMARAPRPGTVLSLDARRLLGGLGLFSGRTRVA